MTAVNFYHLTSTPLERALPRLVEKAYTGGNRVLLIESNPERLDVLNQVLWTFSTLVFLPHGAVKDGAPEDQPILLSPTADNLNQADIAIITDGSQLADTSHFKRIIDMFDGNDDEAVGNARTRWKTYQNSGSPLTYLRQTEQGNWEEKAAA